MTKFQVGELVEVLNADKIVGADEEGIKTGDVVEVTAIDSFGDPLIKGLHLYKWELQYIRKVEPKPTKNQRISALEDKVAKLEKVVAELTNRRPLKPNLALLEEVKKKLGVESVQSVQNQTNNQKRAAIIEKAKKFVEESKNFTGGMTKRKGYSYSSTYYIVCDLEFVVNTEKNAVVALLKTQMRGKLVVKGIAKCHPNDVFNEHIGKAIALGRALGLDVSEFTQAVQPDEVVVGMEIDYREPTGEVFRRTVVEFRMTGDKKTNSIKFLKNVDTSKYSILSDTNAQYEEAKMHESNKAF